MRPATSFPYVVIGLNHKSAPISLRERLAVSSSDLLDWLPSAAQDLGLRELVLLSTCNRVELISCEPVAESDALRFFANRSGVDASELRDHFYVKTGDEAVLHVFRVASSMDSLVVGEAQILGQLKQAFSTSRDCGFVGSRLEAMMARAFSAAKRVRTETSIGSSSVSIASAAVDLSKKIFGSLENCTVLLIGAGKMAELAARHLRANGIQEMLVINRTFSRAEEIARKYGSKALAFETLSDAAPLADIVVTSTGSHEPIIRTKDVQDYMHRRKNRPMFFIDIAVPRDVEAAVNQVDGAFVYDIDDLQQVVASNLVDRSREAQRAEAIIQQELAKFLDRVHELHVVPTIVRLQDSVELMRLSEIERMRSRLGPLTAEQEAAIDSLTRGIVNKVLHTPITALKAAAKSQEAETFVQSAERLFGLSRDQKDRTKR